MAYISERKVNNKSYYYLSIGHRIDGRVKVVSTYLGTKCPLAKSRGWKDLSPDTIERLMAKAKQRVAKPAPNPTLPDGKFAVIYADPPWRYDFAKVPDWSVEQHYETLPTEQIEHYKDSSGTPIQNRFADNAVLFLWSPPPKLEDAMRVITAWGFKYITGAVWDKNRLGMGYWWMQSCEFLLLAKKGEFPAPATKNRPVSVIKARWNGHSKKPTIVYKMIEKMCPLPNSYKEAGGDYYLELFKRGRKRPFWAGWGVEYG